jgi:two-component system chemotaxis response regulator CheY
MTSNPHELRVLVADDDVTCRLVLQATVEKLGHQCLVAVDGVDAWSKIETTSPDVLITDWMMPGVDGPELCRRVRDRADGGYTYVILATSLGQHEHVLEGMESGADDYLTKPISPFDLRTRLIAARRVTDVHKQVTRFHRELERLNHELAQQARTDPLTGLANRLRLHEDLEHHHERAIRHGHAYCVALCDVDRFKSFNDHYGHLEGDHALRRVAQTLQLHSRGADGAYRYGGEEFVVVLTETTLPEAVRTMNRLRHAIEELAIPHPHGSTNGVMTISIGIAVWNSETRPDPEGLLAAADHALYESKANGRNRVTAAALQAVTNRLAG